MGGPEGCELRGFQPIHPEQLSGPPAGVPSPAGAAAPWPGTGRAVVTAVTGRVSSDIGLSPVQRKSSFGASPRILPPSLVKFYFPITIFCILKNAMKNTKPEQCHFDRVLSLALSL